MKNNQIYRMVITALGMALVFIATMFIQIPNALDGYFNLGDGFILLFASFLNPFEAFLIGGLGSALADLASGYGYYFFFTLITKGAEGVVVAYLMKKSHSKVSQIAAYSLGSVVMVFGYFIAKYILKQSWAMAFAEVFPNALQGIAGIVIALFAYPIIKSILKDKLKQNLEEPKKSILNS